nr:MAG TPA: hypothetical protein [Caudoviricetes sp.]
MELIVVFVLLASTVLSGISFVVIYKYIELNRVHGIMIRACQKATLNTLQHFEDIIDDRLDDDEKEMLRYMLQRRWENDSQIVLPFK